MRDQQQPMLFDDDGPRPVADEPRDARQRRLNRERQMRWRRRHSFAVPTYDEVDWALTTYMTCSG